MFDAGYRLKLVRLDRFLTCRDVEHLSRNLSDRYADERYIIRISVLSNIENHGMIPTIFRLQSLCLIYELDLPAVLAWYGVRPQAPERPFGASRTEMRHNQGGNADARLLREMTIAARDFNRARRSEHRFVALKRYTVALRRFTNIMLGEFPDKQPAIRCLQTVRFAITAGSSGSTAQASPARTSQPELRIVPKQTADRAALKLRVLSQLIPYVGWAGANQILESACDDADLAVKVESVLRAFLGKTAGTCLAGRIINDAAVGE